MQLTAVIADDEPVLRDHLKRLLAEQWPDLQVIGETGDGGEVVELAKRQRPDIAFLDISMPVKTGLEAAAEVNDFCRIVFVTAYDEYAIEAFEKQAVDYLLKPVTPERLARTVSRLQNDLKKENRDNKLSGNLIEELLHKINRETSTTQYLQWLKAGKADGVQLIGVDEVCYFQAADKYTRVVTSSGEELIRTSIKKLAGSLDPERFWQIHRATIVNVSNIKCATRSFTGRYRLHLKDNEDILTVSRMYSHLFKQM